MRSGEEEDGEEEEGGGEGERGGSEGKEAKDEQAVLDAGGDGNVETEREINQPRDEEQNDDGGGQAGLSDSELDLRNHLRDDILETVRISWLIATSALATRYVSVKSVR